MQQIIDMSEKAYFITAKVFQEAFFMLPLKERKDIVDKYYFYRINYCGDKKGKLIMKISENLLKTIHSNITSILDEEYDFKDTGKEILNIVCGNLLPEIFSQNEIYKLSSPEIIEEKEIGFDYLLSFSVFFEEGDADFYLWSSL